MLGAAGGEEDRGWQALEMSFWGNILTI